MVDPATLAHDPDYSALTTFLNKAGADISSQEHQRSLALIVKALQGPVSFGKYYNSLGRAIDSLKGAEWKGVLGNDELESSLNLRSTERIATLTAFRQFLDILPATEKLEYPSAEFSKNHGQIFSFADQLHMASMDAPCLKGDMEQDEWQQHR